MHRGEEERNKELSMGGVCMLTGTLSSIHRIHKWRTRGKKLVPSHESEALEGKQKLQMKTFIK